MKSKGNELRERFLSNKDREQTVSGSQGIAMINHGSEVTISVKTPLGRWFRAETTFIGTNSRDEVFLELPALSQADFDQYFYDGFWLKVKAISERGEGAVVNFKTQISNILFKPVRLLVLDLPSTAELIQLRSEPRYDVSLQGELSLSNRKVLVEFTDLSKHGCGFYHDVTGLQFEDNTQMLIMVQNPNSGEEYHLSGKVKSKQGQRVGTLNRYGLIFDELGNQQVKRLLSKLIFDGSKLSFRKN
ncbi:PilZ domain-containing protein [Photobacterium sp. J15]|uniref:PilZ domain-containing protein n=1 Tax=Photobacterium sp. J15 TaxID=265901 RepID=UPI0007E43F14|nr:PilZ domain-containing protein [Photobacterium sp. J15]